MRASFIISLPRAGSTLLQRLLGGHPEIATASEPWLALPFVYALRRDVVRGEYGHNSQVSGLTDFLAGIPEGMDCFQREAGRFIERLLERHGGGGKAYFLDKTPRYHLILGELAKMFPEAKFIVLHRNPLAVVASILSTWKEGRFRLGTNEIDVYEGPRNLISFVRDARVEILEVRYEDLVHQPEEVLARVTGFLGISKVWSTELVSGDAVTRGRLGDKTGIHRYSTISKDSIDAWKAQFASPLRRSWAKSYLHWIGAENLRRLGYSQDELLQAVEATSTNSKQLLTDFIDFNWRTLLLFGPWTLAFEKDRSGGARPRYHWLGRQTSGQYV